MRRGLILLVAVFILVPCFAWSAEIKVGCLYPLTGPAAKPGVDMKNAMELAADIINNKYDLDLPFAKTEGIPNLGGAKLKLIFADHQANPQLGMSEAERLITQEKVVALMGSFYSSVTATASQTAERLKIPFITPEATSPSLTERGFKWFFRITPHDDTMVGDFFVFLKEIEKTKGIRVKNLAILNENSLWGTDIGKAVTKFGNQYGYAIVKQIPYPATTTNVVSEVQLLKAANPDAIFMASYGPDTILYFRTFKELNYTPKAILGMSGGFVSSEYIPALKQDGDYAFTRSLFSLDLGQKRPMIKVVNELFKKRYGVDLDQGSARTFTAVLFLADALNRAKSTDPEKLREAIASTDMDGKNLIVPWDGIKFDEKHQNLKGKTVILQILNQEYFTVWPFPLATKELIWPMPEWDKRKK